jgi:hypothetical protein
MIQSGTKNQRSLIIGLTNLAADIPRKEQYSGHYVFLSDESVPEV